MSINKIYLFLIIFQFSRSLKLSYYFERQSTIGGDDFLHLYINDKNQQIQKKIIYKIPKSFRNKEVFHIKICQKGSMSENQKFNDNNCLHDVYNTINIIEFEEKLLLKQIPIYNIYKICSFGYAFYEAEKSFLNLTFYQLLTNDLIQKNNLFFQDIAKIQEIFEESYQKNFRKDLKTNFDFHCDMEFIDDLPNFNYEGFGKIYFKEKDNKESVFVIEYDFASTNFLIPRQDEFSRFTIPPENLIKARDSIVNSMEKDYYFSKKEFRESDLELEIVSSKKETQMQPSELGNLRLFDNRINYSRKFSLNIKLGSNIEGTIEFPKTLNNQNYLRFFPLLCLHNLGEDIFSYEFIEGCIPIASHKILLLNDSQSNYQFASNFSTTNFFKTNKLNFKVPEMDFEFKAKDNLLNKYRISDFQNNFTFVFDNQYSLVYLVMYQRFYVKNVNYSNKLSFNVINIQPNSVGYDYARKSRNNAGHQVNTIYVGGISLVLGSFFILFAAMGIAAFLALSIILYFVAIICLILFIFFSSNRKFFSNITKYSTVKKMRTTTMEKIWVTPLLLKNSQKEFLVVELGKIPDKLASLDDIPRENLEPFLKIINFDKENQNQKIRI